MKALQTFSDEYLQRCKDLSPEQILEFLDGFRKLHSEKPSKSKLISMKVPEDLLQAFKYKSQMEGTPYQTQIKKLMRIWLLENQ